MIELKLFAGMHTDDLTGISPAALKRIAVLAESHERLLRAAKALWEHGTAVGWKVDEIDAAIEEAEKI